MYQNIQKLRENPDTQNIGKKWSEEEINELLSERENDLSLDAIAIIHKRTPGSIKGKLLSIAASFIEKKKMNIDDISKIIKLSIKEIEDFINKKNKSTNSSETKVKTNKINDLSISEMLNILETKETNENTVKKEIKLNYDQESAISGFKTGKNIFLTGPAGTGKSVTLSKIREECISSNKKFGVTATTGTAAFLIGGKTVHSFLGIGLASESAEELFKIVRYKLPHVSTRLRELQVLIIDEISMLDGALLDKISEYLQYLRKNTNPFGGIQVVLTGDFCQLEPVSGDYCFKATVWPQLKLKTIYLQKLIRQDGDLKFQNILSKVRYGKCSQKTFELLQSLSNKDFGDIKPTILYPRNFDVDKINKLESEKLIESGAKKETYEIEYPKKNKEKTQRWIKSLDIPDSVTFCVGDQVVVLANIDQDAGIVNGTRGIVTNVKSRSVIIKKINNIELEIKYHKAINAEDSNMNVSYIPLKLAYALSIHRSQGMTLDAIEIDIGSKIFAAGQAYTALSRAQDLNSIKIKSISKQSFIINSDVLDFYKNIEKEVQIKNEKFVTKYLNILIKNIISHTDLDKSLDFIWDCIPEEEIEILEFFNNFDYPIVVFELDTYDETNTEYPNNLILNIYKIKKYLIDDVNMFYQKLVEFKII